MTHPKVYQQSFDPTRHLTEDEMEEICLSVMDGTGEDLLECHLLLCPECLEKAELELETVRDLQTALRAFEEPQTLRDDAARLWQATIPHSRFLM